MFLNIMMFFFLAARYLIATPLFFIKTIFKMSKSYEDVYYHK